MKTFSVVLAVVFILVAQHAVLGQDNKIQSFVSQPRVVAQGSVGYTHADYGDFGLGKFQLFGFFREGVDRPGITGGMDVLARLAGGTMGGFVMKPHYGICFAKSTQKEWWMVGAEVFHQGTTGSRWSVGLQSFGQYWAFEGSYVPKLSYTLQYNFQEKLATFRAEGLISLENKSDLSWFVGGQVTWVVDYNVQVGAVMELNLLAQALTTIRLEVALERVFAQSSVSPVISLSGTFRF